MGQTDAGWPRLNAGDGVSGRCRTRPETELRVQVGGGEQGEPGRACDRDRASEAKGATTMGATQPIVADGHDGKGERQPLEH